MGEKPSDADVRDSNNDDGYSWVEITAAILLALATVATAWCAYQSARWSGVMTINFSAANAARSESVRVANRAYQEVTYDAEVLLDYAIAETTGETEVAEGIEGRLFRPELKEALDAWLALDPWTNPEAPRNPFQMPEYTNESLEESESLEEEANKKTDEAKEANQRSDQYVLLAVIFASVLFFAGISTKFRAGWLKVTMVLMGSVVFIMAVVILFRQPVH